MGLVTRRSEQLDKLFDQLAIDPKRKHKPEDKGHAQKDSENNKPDKQ